MDPWDVESVEGLNSLLAHVQVPEPLQKALKDTGLCSISDFAYAYLDPTDLSDFVSKQSPSLGATSSF